MKKMIFIVLFIFLANTTQAQNLNEYKYVIVPESFEFSKSPNQYQLNALTKFLLEKNGFNVLMRREKKPEDLVRDNCLALQADVKNNSGLFVTKLVLVLEDCRGNVVFKSKEGRSREKDYKEARHEALRDAFTSLSEINYSYEADPATERLSDPEEESEPEVVEEPEVAAETPESEQKEQEFIEGKEVGEEETDKTAPASGENFSDRLSFRREGSEFYLEENEEGYALFQEGMEEPSAILIASEREGNFIYNSLSRQGMAYFTDEGNLVVEYFDRRENRTIKSTYELQD